MTKTKPQPCLCQEDAMLEVRKHASEASTVMDMLSCQYGSKHPEGTTIVDYVRALIEAEQDQRRLVAKIKVDAEKRTKEINALMSALRFVSDTTKGSYSSGINVGGNAMSIQLTEVFRVANDRLTFLISSDKGLVEGRQPQNERNFIEEMLAGKKTGWEKVKLP